MGNSIVIIAGLLCLIPLVLAICQLVWREIIGHGTANSLSEDYPLIIGIFTILGIILSIGGTI